MGENGESSSLVSCDLIWLARSYNCLVCGTQIMSLPAFYDHMKIHTNEGDMPNLRTLEQASVILPAATPDSVAYDRPMKWPFSEPCLTWSDSTPPKFFSFLDTKAEEECKLKNGLSRTNKPILPEEKNLVQAAVEDQDLELRLGPATA